MVEGPGATRNGRKVQAVISQVVRKCDIKLTTTAQKDASCANMLVGRRLIEAFSVGKEVFLIFGNIVDVKILKSNDDSISRDEEISLRLHFGMNGSLWLRNSGTRRHDPYPSLQKKESTSLQIFFETETSYQNSTTQTVLEASAATTIRRVSSAFVARSKLNRLRNRDVCGNSFCENSVLKAILQSASVLICDAVLNQDRFPGVGNIIKVEALHEAGIHPRRLVSDLSETELRAVIRECRKYAMKWLGAGRAPTKKVYNRTSCGTCGNVGSVQIAKMGNDLSRVTFWCSDCQLLPNQVQEQQKRYGKTSPLLEVGVNKKRNIHQVLSCRNNHITEVPAKSTKLTKPTPTINLNGTNRCSCPQHGEPSLVLKRVRKNSANQNRIFWSCKRQGCQFFKWADSHLPLCSCRRKAILRISKTERSGGRWFLSCTNKATMRNQFGNATSERCPTGCNLFAWADAKKHITPLGNLLTPLL
mmetsp:Transcript_1851/g.2842  ORF Transcript_1851/g.2842 Transcript_1851/m.2842 type:complete len:474 (-) Transcript_1851:9-1430(-)